MRPPWRDRHGEVSAARSAALIIAVLPAASMTYDWNTGSFGPLPLIGFVYWSGIWAAALILLTLAVTPARHLFRWSGLIDARRIIGVSALIYTVVHVVGYFALYRWDWPGILNQIVTRPSLIVATTSLVGLVALGLTSWDGAVFRIGARNWRRLHRANYLISILAIAHFLLSPGIFSMQYVMTGFLFWLLVWRILPGTQAETTAPALILLALAAGVFAFILQTLWLWAYQQVPPTETLELTFSLEDELAPPWQVLIAGVLIAAATALCARAAKPAEFAVVGRPRRSESVRAAKSNTASRVNSR